MTDISITATTRRAQFTGNTGLGPFAFTFNVLDELDVAVVKNSTELVAATDYNVTVNADGTGSVTLTGSGNGTALISSDVLTILGDRPLSRTSDYTQGGNLFAAALNQDLDSIVIGLQQVDEKIDRAFRIQPGDEFIDLTLPLRPDRADKYFAFNSDGDPVVTSGTTSTLIVTAFAETLLDDTNAAAMLSTLGLTATAAELNLLDGVTATTAEINILDGVTGKTGADTALVTGTAGTDGQYAQWNADGDVVGVTLPALAEAEWEAGTSTTETTVSPAKVKAAVNQGFDNRYYKSSTTSIANNGLYTFTHGLGGVPDITQVYLQCTTAELGYSVGDIIQIIPWSEFEVENEGFSLVVTSSAVEVRIGDNGPSYYTNKNLVSGVRSGGILTASRWDMYVVAVKFT